MHVSIEKFYLFYLVLSSHVGTNFRFYIILDPLKFWLLKMYILLHIQQFRKYKIHREFNLTLLHYYLLYTFIYAYTILMLLLNWSWQSLSPCIDIVTEEIRSACEKCSPAKSSDLWYNIEKMWQLLLFITTTWNTCLLHGDTPVSQYLSVSAVDNDKLYPSMWHDRMSLSPRHPELQDPSKKRFGSRIGVVERNIERLEHGSMNREHGT